MGRTHPARPVALEEGMKLLRQVSRTQPGSEGREARAFQAEGMASGWLMGIVETGGAGVIAVDRT